MKVPDEISKAVREIAIQFLDGTAEAMRDFGDEILRDLDQALLEGRPDLVERLQDQSMVLAAAQGLKLRAGASRLAFETIWKGLMTGVMGLARAV